MVLAAFALILATTWLSSSGFRNRTSNVASALSGMMLDLEPAFIKVRLAVMLSPEVGKLLPSTLI